VLLIMRGWIDVPSDLMQESIEAARRGNARTKNADGQS
jgi:hypothetical protein